MDVSYIHPTQVRALLDGHANGLFRDYHGNIKPIKLCLGLPRLFPGELTPTEPRAELYDSSEADTGIYLDTCFPQKEFGFVEGVGLGLVGVGGEKLEVDREVGRWVGEVVRRIPDEVKVDLEILPVVGERRRERFREEMPLLRRPRVEEWGGEGEYVPKLPEARVSSERLREMRVPFRRSKEEKEADGGDGGMRWSKRVKGEIREWAVRAVAGEKVLGERAVVEWMREVVTRDVGFGEGRVEVLEPVIVTNWDIEEDEVLFPLGLGRKEGKILEGEEWMRVEWPPEREALKRMKSLGDGVEGTVEDELLGEFRSGYIIENLAENDSEALGEGGDISMLQEAFLHIPSSPPTHHPTTSGHSFSPTSLLPSGNKRHRIGYENLYIEGPLTPLPSSPFPFHHDNPKSAKKPRPQLKIDLPPPDPTPLSQKLENEQEKALPAPIIAEGKFFLGSLVQEQLSADDGLLREAIPIMDVEPAELRLAAPWDGVDVLLCTRDGDNEIDVKQSWLGLAGRWWPGDKTIGLELGWRPFTRSTWGMEILRESIVGGSGDGEGDGLLQEVEKGVDVGRKAEEGLIPGDWECGEEEEEEEEELNSILGKKEIQTRYEVEGALGKSKGEGDVQQGEGEIAVQGNAKSNEQRQLQVKKPQGNKEAKTDFPQPSLSRRRQLAAILHDVTSDLPPKRHKRLSPVKRAEISKPPPGFAPVFSHLTTSFSATSSLATFMSMRDRASIDPMPAAPRLGSHTPIPLPLPQPTPAPALQPQNIVADIPQPIIPVPILPPVLPRSQFVISTALLQSHRGIIRAVKALWGAKADWVEREYIPAEAHSYPTTPSRLGSSSGGNEVPPEGEESEQPPLLLSPTAGLFLTSFARIRQRVLLPGEKAVSGTINSEGIKTSISRMARTVGRLWVVVVAVGGITSEKDTEHWCSFLGFCAGVGECKVQPLLIPMADGNGVDDLVAQWVGGVMFQEAMHWEEVIRRFAPWWAENDHEKDSDLSQQHNTKSIYEEEDLITDDDSWVMRAETTGELFLRRAGMNVFAAGVVLREATRLEDEDLQGGVGVMRRLLAMKREERMRLFGGLVGERVVTRLSGMIEG